VTEALEASKQEIETTAAKEATQMTRSLVRWNPRNTMFRNHPMSRLIDEAFTEFLAPLGATDDALGTDWVPPVDILEEDDKLLFVAEMPGLDRESVDITLENQILTLRGERKFERNEEKDNYHRIERAYGNFSRSFRLPTNVDTNAAKASFDNGILTIELPKSAEARPRKLEIG
jgi:HSP20 family protein